MLRSLLERHHAQHVLMRLAAGPSRFAALRDATGLDSKQVARALDFLRREVLVEAVALPTGTKRAILEYRLTRRGEGAVDFLRGVVERARAEEARLGAQAVADVAEIEGVHA